MSITPGMLVRVSPKFRIGRKSPHFGRALVVAIDGDDVIIQPFGRHRQLERVPLAGVRIWKSKRRIERGG